MTTLQQLRQGLESGAYTPDLEKIYGGDAGCQAQRLLGIAGVFARDFIGT